MPCSTCGKLSIWTLLGEAIVFCLVRTKIALLHKKRRRRAFLSTNGPEVRTDASAHDTPTPSYRWQPVAKYQLRWVLNNRHDIAWDLWTLQHPKSCPTEHSLIKGHKYPAYPGVSKPGPARSRVAASRLLTSVPLLCSPQQRFWKLFLFKLMHKLVYTQATWGRLTGRTCSSCEHSGWNLLVKVFWPQIFWPRLYHTGPLRIILSTRTWLWFTSDDQSIADAPLLIYTDDTLFRV